MPKFCTSCGAGLVEGARFCRKCGAAVRQTHPQSPPLDPPPVAEAYAPPQYTPSAVSRPAPGSYLQRAEQWLQLQLVEKAPPLPPEGQEWVVKAAPWAFLVLLALMLPGLLGSLFSGGVFGHGLRFLIGLFLLVLRALALPGLFNRTLSGWRLAYYATLVSAASSVIHFSPFALLLHAMILYLLFQARNLYR
jgi:hypothetical protein